MTPINFGILASSASYEASTSYQSIATLSGNGSSGSLTFSSIPSIYQHLQVRILVRGARALPAEQLYVRLNGDGGNNYAYHYMYGDGVTQVSSGVSSNNVFLVNEFPAANETSGVFSTSIIDILDYGNANKYKTMRSLSGYDNNNNSANYTGKIWLGSGLWMNSTSVTSLTVLSNGAFASNTSVALYGIKG
jgi:hypothetical protein